MVRIEIKNSKNCNSEHSLFITFDFDMKIVEVMRSLPSKFWDATNKVWEVPFNKLGQVVDSLQDYDIDISGQYIPLEKPEVKIPDGFTFKTTPYDHQVDGFMFGLNNDRWLLADEMGCISGDCSVKIKEDGKPATRDIKLKYLYTTFQTDNTIQIKCLINGRFGYLPIKNVVYKGIKKVIKIVLDDTELVCTPDHLIYTEKGWVRADALNIGDPIFTNGKQVCPICGSSDNLITSEHSKFLGYCRSCMYKNRNGRIYKDVDIVEVIDPDGYVRLRGKATRTMPDYSRLNGQGGIYKHHQVWYENTGHIVDTSIEVVHHINGIKTDNRFENLQLLSIREHDKLHSATKTRHLYQFNENLDYIMRGNTKIYLVPQLKSIVDIEELTEEPVYDVEIDHPDIHNFICNNIVVHNCGKTKQVIDIAVAKKLQKGYKHCLIICGVNGLKWNWKSEVSTHSNEGGWILGQKEKGGKISIGSNQDKYNDIINLWENDNYFIITNVESLRDDAIAEALQEACKCGLIGMIAFDEAHKAKNPTSQQGKGILKLQAETMIAMTGTPLMNNPLDLYIILKWLGYEKHAFYSFRKHYCEMGGFGGYEIVGYKNLDELQDRLNEIMLRRLKGDVLDLPEKTYINEIVEMTKSQKKIYDEVTSEIKENIDQIQTSPNPLAELIRMRQATGYPGILSSSIKESAKMDRMLELVEEAVENKQQVVIFSNWSQMTDVIYDLLDANNYRVGQITGDIPDNQRQFIVDSFQNKELDIVIGTSGAMGTGITLSNGTVEIFMDEPWNAALKEQCVDRCHRIGQKNNLTIYTLMCRDSIDERVHEIVEKKGLMADAIVDGKITMNKSELLDFLLS